MGISKYLRFWTRPVGRDVTRLLSEVSTLRQLHQQQAEVLDALHDRIDGVGTHLGDVTLAHLGVTDALRDHLDLRLEVVGDTALATLGEVAHLRAVQGGADASPGNPDAVRGGVVGNTISDMSDDVLALPPRDRHAMLVLSSFFQHPVD